MKSYVELFIPHPRLKQCGAMRWTCDLLQDVEGYYSCGHPEFRKPSTSDRTIELNMDVCNPYVERPECCREHFRQELLGKRGRG